MLFLFFSILFGIFFAEIATRLLKPKVIVIIRDKELRIHHSYIAILLPLFIDKVFFFGMLLGIALHDLLIELKKRFKKKEFVS